MRNEKNVVAVKLGGILVNSLSWVLVCPTSAGAWPWSNVEKVVMTPTAIAPLPTPTIKPDVFAGYKDLLWGTALGKSGIKPSMRSEADYDNDDKFSFSFDGDLEAFGLKRPPSSLSEEGDDFDHSGMFKTYDSPNGALYIFYKNRFALACVGLEMQYYNDAIKSISEKYNFLKETRSDDGLRTVIMKEYEDGSTTVYLTKSTWDQPTGLERGGEIVPPPVELGGGSKLWIG
jgi:hypothetical protein